MDEASTREQLRQNFGTWGPIASIRLVKNKVRRHVSKQRHE